MQNITLAQSFKTTAPALPVFSQSVQASQRHGRLRVSLPIPRRSSCATRRAMIAALRAAELSEWETNGGDFLHLETQI